MNSRYLLCLFILVGFLTSCSSSKIKQANWPGSIPEREFFVTHYLADAENQKEESLDEYLLWVVRFYDGWELYSNGWTKVTNEAVESAKNPADARQIKAKMDMIGQTIACEWPKNKKDRRILTRHIVIWGNALVESIKRGQELALIDRVLADANGLMVNKVGIDDIKADRYFPRDADDVFM